MEPLSLKTRRIYATVSFILLIIILPVAVLYSSGYRLEGLSLSPTGGVFIATPFSDISISLNGEERKRSSIFSKSFLIDNLKAGTYVVQTSASGYYPWSKNLIVEDGVVTDVSALAVSYPLIVQEIISADDTVPSDAEDTSFKIVSSEAYETIAEEFLATTTVARITEDEDDPKAEEQVADASRRGLELFVLDGDIRVRWSRSEDSLPSNFCIRPKACVSEMVIEDWGDTVTRAVFYGGGIVFKTKESGIFFTDIDVRPPRFIIPVYTKVDSDFRIIDRMLIVKEGDSLYEITGF